MSSPGNIFDDFRKRERNIFDLYREEAGEEEQEPPLYPEFDVFADLIRRPDFWEKYKQVKAVPPKRIPLFPELNVFADLMGIREEKKGPLSLLETMRRKNPVLFAAAKAALPTMDYLDVHRRVATNLIYHAGTRQFSQQFRERFPTPLKQVLFYGVPQSGKRFESFEDAIRKGWTGEDSPSLARTAMAITEGEQTADSTVAWLDRHWYTKRAWDANELISDIAMDAVLDYGIVKGLYRPVKLIIEKGLLANPLTREFAAKSFFQSVGNPVLRKGFNESITHAMNNAAGLKTAARNTTDDFLIASFNLSPEEHISRLSGRLEHLASPEDIVRAYNDAAYVNDTVKATRKSIGKLEELHLARIRSAELVPGKSMSIDDMKDWLSRFGLDLDVRIDNSFSGAKYYRSRGLITLHEKILSPGFFTRANLNHAEESARGYFLHEVGHAVYDKIGDVNRGLWADLHAWMDVERGGKPEQWRRFFPSGKSIPSRKEHFVEVIRMLAVDDFSRVNDETRKLMGEILMDIGIGDEASLPFKLGLKAGVDNRIIADFTTVASFDNRVTNLHNKLVKTMQEADAAKAFASEITKRGFTIDYMDAHRLLKEDWIKSYTKRFGTQQKDLLDKVDDFIGVVSNGQAKAIEELSDDQLQVLLDFIDTAAKDPKAFSYLSEGTPGLKGIARRMGRRLVYNQIASPSWQVFERLGAGRVYQSVDDAWYDRYTYMHNKLFRWEQHLAFIDIHGAMGRTKNKEIMRRVFLLADDALTATDDPLKFVNKFKDETIEFPTASILGNEQRAAKFVNDTAKELADMAVSQGRLSYTGVDAPKVIKNYITHGFESAARQTSIEYYDDIGKAIGMKGSELKGLAIGSPGKYDALIKKAMLENPGFEDVIEAANRRAYTDLAEIADIYKYQVKTDVNIPEFMRRIGLREGLIEDADPAFRTMLSHETNALYMEPAYKMAKAMAAETGNKNVIRYTRNWINGLRGVPGGVEAAIEPAFYDASLLLEHGSDWLRKWTHIPVQYKAQNQAVRRFSRLWRQATYTSAMGFNPGPVATNMTQSLLTNAAIGTTYTLRGFESLAHDGGQAALKHCRVLIGRNPMSTLSLDQMSKFTQASGWSFRHVDRWMNCAPAFNGTLWKQIVADPDNLKILGKYGNTQSVSGKWKAISKALDAGEFKAQVLMADHVVKLTQYSYLPHDLPRYLQGPIGKALGQFTTWPANYWTSYLPEMAKMLTGKSALNLMPWDRAAIFKHIGFAEALLFFGRKAGINLEKHSPIAGGIVSHITDPRMPMPGGPIPRKNNLLKTIEGAITVGLSAGDARRKREGMWMLKSGLMMGPQTTTVPFIPFYPQALRRVEKTIESEDLRDMFFRTDKEARKSLLKGF